MSAEGKKESLTWKTHETKRAQWCWGILLGAWKLWTESLAFAPLCRQLRRVFYDAWELFLMTLLLPVPTHCALWGTFNT